MFRAWGLEIGRGLLSWQVNGAVASVETGFCGGIWLAEGIGSAGETVTEASSPFSATQKGQQTETHKFSQRGSSGFRCLYAASVIGRYAIDQQEEGVNPCGVGFL